MKNFIINNKVFKYIGILIFYITLWQICYIIVNQDVFLVSPFSVLHRLFVLSLDYNFWVCILFSLMRVLVGFILAIIIGTALAILMHFSKMLYYIFNPFILIIKSTPVASFVVLALVFIRSFYLPIFISFLMVMPIIWSNIFEGMNKVNSGILQMSLVYRFSKINKIRYIYYPFLKPYFLSAAISGIGFAWKSSIAAEVIANTTMSIGGQILDSKIYMDTLNLFTWTIVIIMLSFILEKIFIRLVKLI